MNGIILNISEEMQKLPVGTSKLFGNPDVWDRFEWPYYTENRENYDLTFLCQINCAVVAPFDKEGALPKTGMLYFFYDMDKMPQNTSDPNAARVLHYDVDILGLHEMLRTDHEGNDMSLRELKLHFSAESDADEFQGRLAASDADELQLLLQVHSFETDNLSIRFADNGTLCFLIGRQKLRLQDFSSIHIRQIVE